MAQHAQDNFHKLRNELRTQAPTRFGRSQAKNLSRQLADKSLVLSRSDAQGTPHGCSEVRTGDDQVLIIALKQKICAWDEHC